MKKLLLKMTVGKILKFVQFSSHSVISLHVTLASILFILIELKMMEIIGGKVVVDIVSQRGLRH